MISKRTMLRVLLSAGVAPLAGASAQAQTYPIRPIRMIVPFAAGTPNDVVARLLADGLASRLGQAVVVDNRPSAGALIGTRAAAAAEPDGYTLLLNSSSLFVAPAMYKDRSYDPLKSFVPVANLVWASWLMVTASTVSAQTLAEFVAHAKANPGKLNFAYIPGTAPQLVGEWLKVKAGMDVTSVAYRGGPQILTDMMTGRVHLYIAPATTLVALIEQGKFRPIAFFGAQRSPQYPQVPTMIESGFPGLSLGFWVGLLAPAGTPRPIVERLNSEVNAVLRSQLTIERLDKLGLQGRPGSPQDFAEFLAEEMPKWVDIVQVSGVTGE
jgi:tripartite-type tricarboxylate transporter receptor subunit TctC